MMAVMEFDAARRGRLIGAEDLERYSTLLAEAVMGALAYFIGHDLVYPQTPARLRAVQGAHIVHMLRDTRADLAAGYFNIPREILEANHLSPEDITHPIYRGWVRQRVDLARRCFYEGRRYIRSVRNRRFRIAAGLYCARFEVLLQHIELDRYLLRADYADVSRLSTWLTRYSQAQRPGGHLSRRSLHRDES
jgi:phytoene/squalene synthetase